jgi:ATP-binding cassette subfamily B protein
MIFITKNDFYLVQRALGYLKPHNSRFILAFLLILVGVGLSLIQPLFTAKLIASFFEKTYDQMIAIVKTLILLFVLTSSIHFTQSYVFSSLNQKIIFEIKRDMFNKILSFPVMAFDNLRGGELISRLNNDAAVLTNIITGQLLSSIVDVLKVIIVGIIMFFLNVKLCLLALVVFPITYLSMTYFGKILRKGQAEIALINDKYFSNIHESIIGIREIKCMGIKLHKLSVFQNLTEQLRDKGIKQGILNSSANLISGAIQFIIDMLIILVGFILVSKGELSVVMYIAFSSYVAIFNLSLMSLSELNSSVQQALVSIKRIFELLNNMNYPIEKFGKLDIKTIRGEIEFEKVCFNYGTKQKIINDISFTIKPNKKIAFVGKSGVGKTTLFNLLLKLYDPVSGRIKIDDMYLEDYSEETLRKHISVVRQTPFLFNMSLKENLLLANPQASNDELIEACNSAQIHRHIISLPRGYDSIVGEGGINFSEGQKQRIAIARALLKKSKIILFDEATSALDNESQYAIKKSIDAVSKNHTIIIIAHRLFTVIDADEIIVFNRGKIVGIGTHVTLLNSNSIYKQLYKKEIDTINKYRD